MENSECGCRKPLENTEEDQKENKDCGCGEKSIDLSPTDIQEDDKGCGCVTKSIDDSFIDEKAKSQCGCGDIEYPDESDICNPNNPKFIADKDFIKELENYAHNIGIRNIGYTQITPELLIKDKFIQYTHTLVLTMEMDKKIIEATPGPDAQNLNDSAYEKLGNITYTLSDYLRKNGYATEVAHPYGGIVKFSLLGQKAGLGYIGQSGLLITPELGPRQKISAIFVSIANLPITECNEHTWITDYCKKCGKCIKVCPEKALVEKETCCGEEETEFIAKLCIGCSEGCTYCIEGCPFDQKEYTHIKDRFDKMNAKLKMKQ